MIDWRTDKEFIEYWKNLVSGVGLQFSKNFIPKILEASEHLIKTIKSSKRLNMNTTMKQTLFDMTSKIIFGWDFQEKMSMIDYIDYDTR